MITEGSIAIANFISWWYTKGILELSDFLYSIFLSITNNFSVASITKTFFKPWRRLVGERRSGFQGFIDTLVDNLVSRGVGMVLRTLVLFVYILFLMVHLGFCILAYIFWFGMPVWILISLLYLLGVF